MTKVVRIVLAALLLTLAAACTNSDIPKWTTNDGTLPASAGSGFR